MLVRTSTLVILAAGILSATVFKWSDLRGGRTIGDIYREAKARRLRISVYFKLVTLTSFILIIVGVRLAFSGD